MHDRQIYVLVGVIDADYRGTIKVLLQNLGDNDVLIKDSQRIDQMICEKADIPEILVRKTLNKTEIHTNRSGSTVRKHLQIPVPNKPTTNETTSVNVIPFDISELSDQHPSLQDDKDDNIVIVRNMTTGIASPYQMSLGNNL